ncbi:MAG TPA: AlkA N-terminal domain-containing protein, partial [Pseudobdellovibrionaceae bacterium]|nr:AlkA N-terminal domain-containing protein [Pseudobdellovibrionaceae bacterium]
SVRRFNGAFKDRFKKAPRDVRKVKASRENSLKISIPYRPPFDFHGLLRSYESHRVGDLEIFQDGKMRRIFQLNGKTGEVLIANHPESSSLTVEIDFPDTTLVLAILSRVRAMFDLDSDPVLVANALERDPSFKKTLRKYPGIRLPSGWDGFEVAVATILGQLVSVERGRILVRDLIVLAGKDLGHAKNGEKVLFFPSAEEIVAADLTGLKTTRQRKETLKSFARAVSTGEISLSPAQDVDEFVEKLLRIRGLGPWTAQYMAMKVLRHTDAFPGTDLVLAKALEGRSADFLEEMSPWRAYAAALLWRRHGDAKTKLRSIE